MKNILALLMIISLGGCGVIQGKKMDDLQTKSTPEDWGVLTESEIKANELISKAMIKGMLKDPDSATFRYENPKRMIKIIKGEPELVWYSNVYVNAKNSFGGYVGERRYVLVSKCYRNAIKKCETAGFGVPNSRYPGDIDWIM